MLSDTKLFTPELGRGGGGWGEFSLQTPDLSQAFSFSHELGWGGGDVVFPTDNKSVTGFLFFS